MIFEIVFGPCHGQAEMEAAELKPDVVTYTSLMALLVKASPNRGRTSPAQRSKSNFHTQYSLIYSVRRAVHSSRQCCPFEGPATWRNEGYFLLCHLGLYRLEKVMDLYKEMRDRNVQPDAINFNTIMYAGAQAKLPGKVLVRNCH